MQYIVIDLEWNQAISSDSPIFNKLPFHLRGEIIQIGAVRLSDDMNPLDEFKADIKPVYFRQMHHRVKKLTGLNKTQLRYGLSFETALEWMHEWCGGECVLLTWGYDDKYIMEQNLLLHDLDASWIKQWVNLQLLYNMQVEGDKNQKSLTTAMEHFSIEQTRIAHDALGDAYNTALVCSMLDLKTPIESAVQSLQKSEKANKTTTHPVPLAGMLYERQTSPREYTTTSEAFSDAELTNLRCPVCGLELNAPKFISQGSHRYMTLAECPEHGSYLLRIKLRKLKEDLWSATRILYEADEDMRRLYEKKSRTVWNGSRRNRHNTKQHE